MEVVSLSEIKDQRIHSLILASQEAREVAYCPYSKFAVGAALLCDDETVVTGCNVENCSYGLTICAERTAVVKAVSCGKRKFPVIAISAVNGEILVSPCGACRQFLTEFNSSMKVYLFSPKTGKVGITSLNYLLPAAVTPTNMDGVLLSH